MMMRDVATKLISQIEGEVVKNGFKLNKNSNMFTRNVNDAKQIYKFYFYKSNDGVLVEPNVLIKLNSIEKIYRQVKKENYSYEQIAIGTSLGKIIKHYDDGLDVNKSENIYYLITDDESIFKLSNALNVYFYDYVLRYFDENSSIDRFDCLLNKQPRDISIHHRHYPLRASVSLIAAKLTDNPNYTSLVDVYTEKMKEAVEPYKQDFEKIKILLAES